MKKITDHAAVPGPMYWDFRCLICDGNVVDHYSWLGFHIRRLFRKVFK